MSLPTRRPLRGCFYRNRTLAGRPARSGNLIPPRLLPQHLKRKGRLLPHNTAFSGRFGRPGRPAPPRRWCPRVDGGCSKPRCVPPAARTRVALPRPHSPCSTGCPSSDRTTRARRRHPADRAWRKKRGRMEPCPHRDRGARGSTRRRRRTHPYALLVSGARPNCRLLRCG